jgi:hypothetical protein
MTHPECLISSCRDAIMQVNERSWIWHRIGRVRGVVAYCQSIGGGRDQSGPTFVCCIAGLDC